MPVDFSQYQEPVDFSAYGGQMDESSKKKDKSVLDFANRTLPNSAVNFVKDTGNTILHPINSAKNLLDTAVGGISLGAGTRGFLPEQEEKARNFGQSLKNRYGSFEKAGNTLYEDPIGTAADVSTIVEPLSGVKNVGRVAEIASKVTNPMRAVTEPLGAIGRKVLNPESIYKGAIRDVGEVAAKDIPEVTNYGLNVKDPQGRSIISKATGFDTGSGITLNQKGLDKTHEIFKPVESEINRRIDATDASGGRIRPNDVIKPIESQIGEKKASSLPSRAEPYERVRDEFLGKYPANQDYSVREAQNAKRADYKDLNYDRSLAEDPAKQRAEKLLAAGQRQAIEDEIQKHLGTLYPSLSELNDTEGHLSNLRNTIVKAIENQKAGIKTPRGGQVSSVSGAVAGSKYHLTKAGIQSILASPEVRSKLAIALNSVQGRTGPARMLSSSDTLNKLRTSKYTIKPDEIPVQ